MEGSSDGALYARVVLDGLALGWSVAWIPGPINAEMLRRGIAGGFRRSFPVGLGATSADFCWALLAAGGLGALAASEVLRAGLSWASLALLAGLGLLFLRDGWRAWRAASLPADPVAPPPPPPPASGRRASWALGFTMAALSPFNLAFWLAAFGTLEARGVTGGGAALALAGGVTGGAMAWCLLYCGLIAAGARFASARWQAATRLLSAAALLAYAARLAAGMAA